ncbi:Ig-like domain-containing protein [Vibrio owensii]|uniref:Ig-like domain-containing protein n=1 Tax=Vibrio owensii TaxID=696485 RepID=UPI003AAC65AB
MDGEYEYSISVTTNAGSSTVLDGNVTIDTVAPETDVMLVREDGTSSDTGFINTTTPSLTGQTEPGATIVVSVNGEQYSVYADEFGQWQFNFSELSDGVDYTYEVQVTDKAGNVSDSYSGSFTVDTEIPVTPTTGLHADSNSGDNSDGNTVTNVIRPTLEGMGEAGSKITVTFADGSIFETIANEHGYWSIEVGVRDEHGNLMPFTTDGSYDYIVKSEDAAGNVSESVSGNITIDTVKPFLTGGLDSASDTLNPEAPESDISNHGNDDTPSFSGTATPGQTVVLVFNNKTYSFDVPADSVTGEWIINIPLEDKLLNDGEYQYSLSVTTPSGNHTVTEGSYLFDSQVETDAGIAQGSDTGADDSDNLTFNKRPDFAGKTEPGAVVKLTYNDVEYEVTVAADGSWTLAYPEAEDLADGTYSFTLDITDAAGNTIENQLYSFTVDTVAETTLGLASSSIGGDGSDATLTNSSRPTFQGKAEPGSIVTFVFGDSRYEVAVDDEGNWRFTMPSGLAVGEYDYSIETTDKAGNTNSYDGEFIYVLDGSLPPKGTVVLDAEDDSGIKGDMITNNTRPTITGQVEPTNSTGKIFINGVGYDLTIGSDGSYSFDLPAGVELREGSNQYEVVFTHPDNGLKQTLTGSITVDSIAESFEVSLDTDTGSVGDWHTKTRSPSFSGEADAGATVDITINGKNYSLIVPDNGQWSFTLPESLVDGTYSVDITITDLAGNESSFSKELWVDNVSQTLVYEDFELGSGFMNTPGGWAWSGNGPVMSASDSLINQDPNATVRFTYNGQTRTFNIDELFHFGPGLFPLNDMIKAQLKIEYIDSAGNESVRFWNNVAYYNFKPTITGGLTNDSNSDDKNDNLTSETRPDLFGTTNAEYWDQGRYSGTIEINGKSYALTFSNVSGKVAWSFNYPDDAPALDSGVYDYKVTINSGFGSGGSGSMTGQVVIQNIDINLDAESNSGSLEDWLTNDTSPTLTGTTSSDATLRVQFNGIYYDIPVQADGTWSFTPPTSPLEDGEYTIVLQESIGGNVTTIEKTLVIDTIPPSYCTVSISSASNPGSNEMSTGDSTPKIHGMTEPGATVTLTLNGQSYILTANDEGYWGIGETEFLEHGVYDYTVSVRDSAGNQMEPSLTGQLTVDTEVDATLEYKLEGYPAFESGNYYTNDMLMVGSGRPGLVVTFTSNGQTLTTTVGEDGRWSIDAGHLFGHQANNATYSDRTLTFTDPETGGTKVIEFDVKFDQTIFEAWVGLDPDSKTCSTDPKLTCDGTPSLKGRAEAYNKVVIHINGEDYEVITDASGYWTFDIPGPLADGHYEYSITVTDKNLETFTAENEFTLDTSEPTFTIEHTSPDSEDGSFDSNVEGDNITSLTNHLLSGTIGLSNSIVVKINGEEVAVTLDELGNWSLALNELVDGVYNYEITVGTAAGKESTVMGSFTVDTVVESATNIELDLTTDSGLVGDGITNNQTPKFSGSAEAGATIAFVINGVTYTTVADSFGRWALTVTDTLPEGDYPYSVTVTDVAGNVSTETTGNVTILTSADAEASISVGLVDGAIISNDATPQLSGTTSANSQVQVIINGKVYNTTANSDGEWTLVLNSPLVDGEHELTANVLDSAGNVVGSENLSFTIDTQLEANLQGVIDADGELRQGFTNDTTPTFKGTAEVGATVVLIIDGQRQEIVVGEDGNWQLSIDSALAEGTYNYEITITDNAGNERELNGSLTVDTENPTELSGGLAADSHVDSNDDVTTSNKPNFEGTTEPGATVTLTIGDKVFTVVANALGAWSIDYETVLPDDTGLAPGEHHYTISVTDKAGNTIEIPHNGSFTVITEKPATDNGLLASDDSGTQGDNVTNNTTPSIGGVTSVGATITVTFNHIPYVVSVDSSGQWRFDFPAELAEGTYSYTVTAVDKYGNSDSKDYSFTIDLTPAEAPSNVMVDGAVGEMNIVGDNTPILRGQAEAGATIRIQVGDKVYTTVTDSEGNWAYEFGPLEALPNGEYDFSITAQDSAGNTVSEPTTGSFTVSALTAVLAPTQDGDASPSGDSTVDTTPTFIGTGMPGATITLTINGQEYEALVNSDGAWSVNVNTSLLPREEAYEYTIEQNADGVITSNQGSVSIVIDAAEPAVDVVVDGSVGDDNFVSDSTPVIRGKAEVGCSVEIQVGEKVYTTVVNEDGTWEYEFKEDEALANGEYMYSITVIDPDGNAPSTPTTGSFTVSTLSVGLSVEQDGDEAPTDNTTIDTTPTFNGTGLPGAVISLTINEQVYTTTVNSAGTWSLSVTSALAHSEVSYDYTVEQNLDGIITSTSGSVTIIPDAEVMQMSLDDGSSNARSNTSEFVTFNGESAVNSLVVLNINQQTYEVEANSEGKWSIDVRHSALNEGANPYTLLSSDEFGFENISQGTYDLDSGEILQNDTQESISDDLIEFEGQTQANADVTLFVGGETYQTTANSEGVWQMEIIEPNVVGEYDYQVTCEVDGMLISSSHGKLPAGYENTEAGSFMKQNENTLSEQSDNSSPEADMSAVTFEGTLQNANSEVTFTFNDQDFSVEYSEDGLTWMANVPAEFIASENAYQVHVASSDGENKTVNGVFEQQTSQERAESFNDVQIAELDLTSIDLDIKGEDEF